MRTTSLPKAEIIRAVTTEGRKARLHTITSAVGCRVSLLEAGANG